MQLNVDEGNFVDFGALDGKPLAAALYGANRATGSNFHQTMKKNYYSTASITKSCQGHKVITSFAGLFISWLILTALFFFFRIKRTIIFSLILFRFVLASSFSVLYFETSNDANHTAIVPHQFKNMQPSAVTLTISSIIFTLKYLSQES